MASPSPAEDREVAYRRLIDLGIALSAEHNHNRLLETILLGAKELTNADGGTLYRVLFLSALLLFLMTFVLNTAAELIRLKLRRKYRHL